MNSIYPMLALTLLVGTLLLGGYLAAVSRPRGRYLWLLLLGLPLSLAVNVLVKAPLALWVGEASGYGVSFMIGMPLWLLLFLHFLAPVTEEAIKILPLAIPAVRRLAQPKLPALLAGFALGISFGLGEAAFIGASYALSPQTAAYPWFYYTGFFIERILASFAHGVMTAVFVSQLAQGRRGGLLGYLAAVLLHAFLNLGAVLYQMGLIDVNTTFIHLLVAVALMAALFKWLQVRYKRQDAAAAVQPVLEAESLE